MLLGPREDLAMSGGVVICANTRARSSPCDDGATARQAGRMMLRGAGASAARQRRVSSARLRRPTIGRAMEIAELAIWQAPVPNMRRIHPLLPSEGR